MMGLREFDAFLLVVDDVPWGGAFNPALATLDLTDVDRIEILRGAAPVLYGATSFIGVIHVIHRAPTRRNRRYGSPAGASAPTRVGNLPLPSAGAWHQSISAGYDSLGYRDDRTNLDRGHLLYRGASTAGEKPLSARLRRVPSRPGPGFAPSARRDVAHHAGPDRREPPSQRLPQNEERYHLVLGHSRAALGGDWATTLAFTRVNRDNTKGFLRPDPDFDTPPGVSNADGFRQSQDETDIYFDTHLTQHPGKNVSLVFGLDELYGDGSMDSDNFEYHVNLDGSGAPDSHSIQIDERPHLEEHAQLRRPVRQAIWTPAPRWRLELGARLNMTHERREGEVRDGDNGTGASAPTTDTRSITRGGGSVGVSFRAWQKDVNSLWLFTDYRNTFKPAAIDFGPEAEGTSSSRRMRRPSKGASRA